MSTKGNVQRKHSKGNKGALIVSFFAILMIITALLGVLSNGFKNFDLFKKLDPVVEKIKDIDTNDVLDEFGNKINDGLKHTFTKKMSFSQGALTASENQGVTVTLEATVLPVDAKNKEVDWEVSWESGTDYIDDDVSDYLTVTPLFEGSNIVNVTCLKSFGGDTIAITVTTRDGNLSAECLVSFVGMPSTFVIDLSNTVLSYDNGWGVDINTVIGKANYMFPLNFDNIFHDVGSKFNPIYEIEVVGFGLINVKTDTYISGNGENGSLISNIVAVNINSTLSLGLHRNGNPLSVNILDKLVDVQIVNNYLNVNVVTPIIGFNSSIKNGYMNRNSEKVSRGSFESYVDLNKVPYIQIKVTETTTKLSQTVNFRCNTSVASVSLANSTLSF